MHMDADTAVSILHLEASAGKGEVFPPCPWVCPLSPCTRGNRAGCPGLQRENMRVNLGRIAGCLAQSLSIRIPSGASVCVCSLLGHLGAGHGIEGGKPLCCGYILLGPHKLGSSFRADALEGFGWRVSSSTAALHVGHASSGSLPRILLLLVSPAAKTWLLPWGGTAAPEKGSTDRLGQMVRKVVFIIPAGQSPGSDLSSSVTSPQSHQSPCACSRQHKLLPHPLQYLQHPRGLHPFTSMDCAREAPESTWMQPDGTAGRRKLKEKKVVERANQPKSVYGDSILFKEDSKE